MKSLKLIYAEVPARRLLRPPVHVDLNLGTKRHALRGRPVLLRRGHPIVMVILEDSRYNELDASTAMVCSSKIMPPRTIPMAIARSKLVDVFLSRWFHCVSRGVLEDKQQSIPPGPTRGWLRDNICPTNQNCEPACRNSRIALNSWLLQPLLGCLWNDGFRGDWQKTPGCGGGPAANRGSGSTRTGRSSVGSAVSRGAGGLGTQSGSSAPSQRLRPPYDCDEYRRERGDQAGDARIVI